MDIRNNGKEGVSIVNTKLLRIILVFCYGTAVLTMLVAVIGLILSVVFHVDIGVGTKVMIATFLCGFGGFLVTYMIKEEMREER